MGGTPYNGYTSQQRNKISLAHFRATGRRDPFVGQACAMCGDPDRAPGEWHSEDYAEPFSYEPPACYPMCKPCHGRLHKRFNALPGEWQLFCLHLASGGYGKEFVQKFALQERRDLWVFQIFKESRTGIKHHHVALVLEALFVSFQTAVKPIELGITAKCSRIQIGRASCRERVCNGV